MEKKYNKSHVKETYITKQGYTCKVIDGGSKHGYCTIKINNWITEVQFTHVKRGNIKYPLHPSVFNIAYVGIGNYSLYINRKATPAYKIWKSMLQRCYDLKWQEKQPTYTTVVVCKKWLNYQNFAEWFYTKSNYKKGWQLDKDLLSKNNKVYSPKTCLFIPQALNVFLSKNKCTNTSGYTGVTWDTNKNKWRARIYEIKGNRIELGFFTKKEDAANIYFLAQIKEANKWKEKMKNILPQQAIDNIR